MSRPLISIIIPVYNAERTLAATIRSALDQTWDNTEIVVVDDGSSDRSAEIAHSFASAGVTVIAQPNRGGSAARNRGFWASRGAVVQFLDHDDLLAPDKLALQMAAAERLPATPVMGRWIRFRGDTAGTYGPWFPDTNLMHDMSAPDWLIAAPMVPTSAWLYPRETVVRAGLWNESLHDNPADDFEFQVRIAAQTRTIAAAPDARTYFRAETTTNAGSNRGINALTSVFQTCHTYRRTLLAMNTSEAARGACAARYTHFMYLAYPRCPEMVAEAERIVRDLGVSPRDVEGTPMFNRLRRLCGWKTARRVQVCYARLRGGVA